MAELTPLRQLLTSTIASTDIVTRRKGVLLTQADLCQRAGQWAATLRRWETPECALYMRDGFEFISILLGAWQAGKRVWLPGDAQAGTYAKLREHVSLFVGEFNGEDVLCAPDNEVVSLTELAPEQPALMVFTSGSTGTPTAIPKTLQQLDAEIAAMQAQWGDWVGDVPVLASVPHQHFYGLLFKVLWPLSRGACFESLSVDYPEQISAALAQENWVWIGSPALLSRLPADMPWQAEHLRAVFCSGGPLSAQAAQDCTTLLGQWPLEVYGSSETGAVAWRIQAQSPAYWRPLPGAQVQREVQSGQLLVAAPWVGTAPWLMADRGEVQADGGFTLLGRADRIVKVAEKRISLDALECVLHAQAEVQASRLIQFADGRLGAVVVLSAQGQTQLQQTGRAAVIERLRKCLENEVERVALPRRWRFVEDFPRNALGKITGADLLALFEQQEARPSMPQICRETILADAPRQLELEIFIQPDLIYFDGHFPEAPILPGVAQVEWAVALARRYFALHGPFLSMAQIKFQQVIQPGATVLLTLTHVPAKSAAEFRYQSSAGAHSSGRLLFGAT